MLRSTQYPKGTSQNIPLKVVFKALTINKRIKATLKSQRTEQAELMTQNPNSCAKQSMATRVWEGARLCQGSSRTWNIPPKQTQKLVLLEC